MSPLAVDLNDRALSFARNGDAASTAPSAIVDSDSQAPAVGAAAWSRLRLRPTSVSTRHLGALLYQDATSPRDVALVAAELQRRFALHAPAGDDRVWFATPARVHPTGMGVLLGIAQSQHWPVEGFVDSAALAAAALDVQGPALVLEIGLHHAAVTSIESAGGQARRRRAAATASAGLLELYQAWLDLIRTTLVRRTRFDAFHEARTEQQLFDALPQFARRLAGEEQATASLERAGERFEVTLSRDQLIEAAGSVYRRIIGLVQELRPAGAPVTLIVPQCLGEFPGFREQLECFAGCDLIWLADGLIASFLSSQNLPQRQPDEPVRLLRRWPCSHLKDRLPDAARERLGLGRAAAPQPSHLVLDGHPYPLTPGALLIGRSPDEGAPPSGEARRSLRLPEGVAGVSRRHCTLVHQGGAVSLIDHSRFGTFVNGEQVVQKALLFAGDRIRLGQPGVELTLIAIGAGHEP